MDNLNKRCCKISNMDSIDDEVQLFEKGRMGSKILLEIFFHNQDCLKEEIVD